MKKFCLFLIIFLMFAISFFTPADKQVFAQSQVTTIYLTHNKQSFAINLKNFGLKQNSFAILSSSRQFFRNQTIDQKLETIKKLSDDGMELSQGFEIFFEGINKEVDYIIKKIEFPYKNATLKFNPKNESFKFFKEQSGLRVEKEEIFQTIFDALKNNQKFAQIKSYVTVAPLKLEDVKNATFKRAEFKTNYASSTVERKHNIALALSKFNGLTIMPGEKLSFNQTTGKRTEEKGYKNAKIIVDGAYVEGTAGGVCQASTTLYNACLLAGLDVETSRPHTLPAHYVDAGFDAMVSQSTSDLVIKNNTKLPISFKTICGENGCKVIVFGGSLKNTKFELISEKIEDLPQKNQIEYKQSQDKTAGETIREKFDGFVVQTYRLTIIDGKVVKKEKLRKSKYQSLPKQVAI